MKRATLFLLAVTTASSCLFAQTTKNPFSKMGYKKQITYTSSKGEFEEFHDNADVVEIGSVYFNTKTKKVVGYVNEEKENAEVATATSAMSVDPLCEKYYWISPYAFCLNNPVKYVDPDGRDVALRFYGNGTAEQYQTVVNNALEGQYEMYYAKGGPNGYVLMGIRATEGGGDITKMTENGQAFLTEMNNMISNRDVTAKISVASGDENVTVGNYKLNQIDIADISQFNATGPNIKESVGATQAGKLAHEVKEQFLKAGQGIPIGSLDNSGANHRQGVKTEDFVNGNTRLGEKVTSPTSLSVRYKEKNGRITVVSYDTSSGTIKVYQPKPVGLRR